MQQQTALNLIKGDYAGPETDYRDALPVNMYAVVKPILGAAGYMVEHSGLTEYGTGAGPDRGGVFNDQNLNHFRVSSSQFLVVNEDGSNTRYGNIPGTETVSMPYSFNTQAVIGGGNFYLFDFDNGFRQVTDPDVGAPIDGVWIDGYYVLTDGEFLYHTDLADESSIDPLKFATSEFAPDRTLGLGKTQDNKFIAFNRYSTEYFANVASAQFAFQRIPSRAVKIGIVSTHGKCELNQNWYLLGGRKEGDIGVHVLGVGSSKEVSTREINKVIGKYTETELENAVVESRSNKGTGFIIVHLPDETLLYNENVGEWSILQSGVAGAPWRGIHGLFEPRLGEWVYGDKQTSRIGILDDTVNTQYGELAEWILYTPFVYLERASIDELAIEILPGFTVTNDATVFISLTYDGVLYGKEWTLSYGAPMNYNNRFEARRLGNVNNWVGFKLRGASRSKMAFSRATIQYG